MGYTTDFVGEFTFDKPLLPAHVQYLKDFAGTRRMGRRASAAEKLSDPVRITVGLPIGEEGAYFVGAAGDSMGQTDSPDIVDYNAPPAGQPSLWCQWVPSSDGTSLSWDGGEKFYSYVEWLAYLIEHFIKPWGYKLNGEVARYGEDSSDLGKIEVYDNKINVKHGTVIYE